MITVKEAVASILSAAEPTGAEKIAIGAGEGRILAADIVSPISQPPFRASAMDGYAVRFDDAALGARLTVTGEAAAGSPTSRNVGDREAVRIFTGGAVPDGADHVVIQEDVRADGRTIVIAENQARRANIREAGIDFAKGQLLKRKGDRLSATDLGFIASANLAAIDVCKRPVVAYFDNGDELKEPGENLAHGEIVGSNRFALDALIRSWGGSPLYLGRAGDRPDLVREKFAKAEDADILVTIGGASVGDHDHVRSVFAEADGKMVFSKIAVRPGKPTWFGTLGRVRVLGLPGNPASAIVCAILFLKPLIEATGGARMLAPLILRAALDSALKANGPRETYLRGLLRAAANGSLMVKSFTKEDSSLYSPLIEGNCLIRRAADAREAHAGEIVDCLLYGDLGKGVAA